MPEELEKRVKILESQVIQLQTRHEGVQNHMNSISEDSKENSGKIDKIYGLLSTISKNLALLSQEGQNRLEKTTSKLDSLSKGIAQANVRSGGIEDILAETREDVAGVKAQQKVYDNLAGKSNDRTWNMAKLIPIVLITALISSGITVIVKSIMATESVAIKQTQIDKLQRQLDRIKEG